MCRDLFRVREGPCILQVDYKVGRQNFQYTVTCATHRAGQGLQKPGFRSSSVSLPHVYPIPMWQV